MADQDHTPTERPIRILIGKPGLDGHDRGAKVVARTLQEAGMDVTYSGLHHTPEELAEMAIEGEADVIGLSILSGAHTSMVERLSRVLRDRGAGHIVVLVGGTIPAQDVPLLEELGVSEVFTPGALTGDIRDCVLASVETHRKQRQQD